MYALIAVLSLSEGFITPAVSEKTELELMRLIVERPTLSQREAASTIGISLGKANYCLRALVAKGFVKTQNYRNSDNKLAYLYLLTPSGIAAKAALTRRFLAFKLEEYERLQREIERLREETAAVGGGLSGQVPGEEAES